jgi:hypothetical protein
MRVLVVGEVEAPHVFINQKTGQPQCQLEVTADNVRFLTSKDELEAHYREQSHGVVAVHPGQPEIEVPRARSCT